MKSLKQILSAIETLEDETARLRSMCVNHEPWLQNMSYHQSAYVEAAADALRWVADMEESITRCEIVTQLLGESCDEVERDTSPSEN